MTPINKDKKTLSSIIITLSIVAMLILIQPMAGIQVSFENLPSSCNVNEEVSFKAKIEIQSQEWSDIQNITLTISKDGKVDKVNIPINLTPNAIVVQNIELYNTSSEIIEIKVDSETNAVSGYGYGYDYINESRYGYITYQTGYGYGYNYGYITGYGYGYNVINSLNSAFIVYDIKWKPKSAGTYKIKLEVVVKKSDGETVLFTKEQSIEVKETTTTTHYTSGHYTSGGGGGIAISSEETETPGVVAKVEIKTQFEPGKPIEISIPFEKAKELGILGLTLEYQQQVQAKVMIAKLASLPSTIEKPAIAKDIYNIIEIKVIDEATGKEIEPKGWIKFMVSKKWLKEKGYNPDDVVMLRYHNGWETLETQKLGIEDAENIYYKAYTPGFSIFAVAIKAEEEKPTTTEEETTTKTTTIKEGNKSSKPTTIEEKTTTTKEVTTQSVTEETKGSPWTAIIMVIAVLVIIGVGAYLFIGKKK
ncbi:PGF-pre-PGF domain-containing protein [Methanocaldococcus indicus]|uniref:PGF-pre-PGF domain-containing protein n=1 Tax=Methanocaldococcus indicus TaxID=213231 RepID=UPI003C6D591B